MSSVEGDKWFGHDLKRDPNTVETEVHKAFMYAKALNPNQCVLKMIVNANPHLDYIP